MPCSCGKKKSAASSYEVTLPDGSKRVFSSELQAKAAMIRAGGGTIAER